MSLQEYSRKACSTARTVIDGGLAGEAARNVTAAQLATFRRTGRARLRTVADPVAFRLADVEFHELIGTAASNAFLDRVSRALYSLAIEQRRMASQTPGVIDQSARDHDAIVKAHRLARSRRRGRGRHGRACRAYSNDDARRDRRRRSRPVSHKIGSADAARRQARNRHRRIARHRPRHCRRVCPAGRRCGGELFRRRRRRGFGGDAAVDEVVAEIEAPGRKAIAVEGNIADPATAATLVQAAIDDFGGVDMLASNAGICPFHAFLDMPADLLTRTVVDVNLNGAFFMPRRRRPTR